MENLEYIRQLEQRILELEQFINNINFGKKNDIHIANCPIAAINIGEGCNLSFNGSSVGSVMQGDIDDAENRVDDLECRIEDIKCLINDAEQQIEDMKENTEDD